MARIGLFRWLAWAIFRTSKRLPAPFGSRKKGRPVSVTVRQLAGLVQGSVLGDGDLPIQTARSLSEAQQGDITFLENERKLGLLHTCRASAVVVPSHVQANGKTLIRVKD